MILVLLNKAEWVSNVIGKTKLINRPQTQKAPDYNIEDVSLQTQLIRTH
jgi:hypothetical protein